MKPYRGTCEGRLLALPWGRRVGGGKRSCEEREVGELLAPGLLPLSHLLVRGSLAMPHGPLLLDVWSNMAPREYLSQ